MNAQCDLGVFFEVILPQIVKIKKKKKKAKVKKRYIFQKQLSMSEFLWQT